MAYNRENKDWTAWDELKNATNLAADSYWYEVKPIAGFDNLSIGYVLSGGVTLTVEAHLDSEDNDSPTWFDITKAGYETTTDTTGATSFVDLTGQVDFDKYRFKGLRVKIVTSDNTNSIKVNYMLERDDR